MTETPPSVGRSLRLARRLLHAVGGLEATIFRGRNHLAQALFLVAERSG
jgi:hypothetical protein